MKRRRRTLLWPAAALLLVSLVLAFCGPLDSAVRLYNFSALTHDELVREARVYVDQRADGRQAACLYVVRCDGGRARLGLVPALTAPELEAAKGDIWHRRTSGFCPGRTTNIGLQLIPETAGKPQIESISLARWSFFNDRFIPRSGRFQSGSFSDEPWEPCTLERALIRSPGAPTPQTPPPASAGR